MLVSREWGGKQLFILGVLVSKTTPRALFNTLTNCDGRLSWRSNSIPFFLIKPFKEETEHLPAAFALKRTMTRYNFGAARDPEMLHKIYNAKPFAPFIRRFPVVNPFQKNNH